MPRWLHVLLQGTLVGGQFIVPVLAPKHQQMGAASLAALNAFVGVINQAYNTDGTPQEKAFGGIKR